MAVLTLIERELRAALRRVWTIRLRYLFAGVALLTCLVVLTLSRLPPPRQSYWMLMWLGVLGLGFALFTGALLTADCVSEEKREGTLGLLFLTPLRGWHVLLGKLTANAVPSVYGLLGAFPVFFLPLLNGGVTWQEILRILLALGVTLLLSLTVGLFVSVRGTESRNTVLGTLVLLLGVTLLPLFYQVVNEHFLRRGWPGFGVANLSPWVMFVSGFENAYQRTGGQSYWGSVVLLLILSLVFLSAAIWQLPRCWQAGLGSGTPSGGVHRSGLRKRRVRALGGGVSAVDPCWRLVESFDDEPGWLRFVRAVLLLVFGSTVILTLSTRSPVQGFVTAMGTALVMSLFTKLFLALEATRRLHQDRRSGALELLLVTPLSVERIVTGLRRGVNGVVWRSVAWVAISIVVLIAAVIGFPRELEMQPSDQTVFLVLFGGALAALGADRMALQWVGLHRALRATTHLRAAFVTFGIVMLPSWAGLGLVVALLSARNSGALEMAAFLALWHLGSVGYSVALWKACRLRVIKEFRRLAAGSAD